MGMDCFIIFLYRVPKQGVSNVWEFPKKSFFTLLLFFTILFYSSLSFDIQRVHSGKLEELEAAEIITFR